MRAMLKSVSKRPEMKQTVMIGIMLGVLMFESAALATTSTVTKGSHVQKSRLNQLNLTEKQRQQWNAIFQKYKQKAIELQHEQAKEIDAILTPAQRKIIKEENERRAKALTKKIMLDEVKRKQDAKDSGQGSDKQGHADSAAKSDK
jgi:Spy/CpxP family protein refolding chaperone